MKWFPLLLTLCLSAPALAASERNADGSDARAPWTLLDQHDTPYTLDDTTQVLLVARSMASAKMVNAALGDEPGGYLEARKVIYVADVERMPSVAKMVMVPAMRSASYRIVLDQTGAVAGRYGGDRDTVQWVQLEGGQMVQQRRFSDVEQLRTALAQLPH
ncbi:hypothetical protein [Pseudomonas sp. UBA6562]|uniref:hypothetical protein n=1 Tax=Pseudomonas sp. UBA6562 TaxID=1947332 RepID=UPI0025D07FA2|nr:hypothetical protein [Pseudomonas sp. UBA6562]